MIFGKWIMQLRLPHLARRMRLFVILIPLVACSTYSTTKEDAPVAEGNDQGIHKIKHIIIIMQENRSFDEYFGTYPGADGIPRNGGNFTVCVPNPATGECVPHFHNVEDVNGGGPHGASNAVADLVPQ